MRNTFLFFLFLFCIRPACASAPLDLFDATPILKINPHDIEQRRRCWDQQQLLAALQGLANRREPHLYIFAIGPHGSIDHYWLTKLQLPNHWLAHTTTRTQKTLADLLRTYRSSFNGLVVWDERVPATALVASTAAGADDLLPVRYDPRPGSLYTFLTNDSDGPHLPIRVRLLNADNSPMFTGQRTGSAKCDAVLWAVDHYLRTGKCNPLHLAYYPDAYWLTHPPRMTADQAMLFNHDYFISERAFFFDLDPWNDESPDDDPHQRTGTDANTLITLMRTAYDRAGGQPICVGGFVPWPQKYTKFTGGKHDGVATEWRYAEIISCFEGYMDADAFKAGPMANASVFCHFPLADQYPQPKAFSASELKPLLDANGNTLPGNYATIYVGDYDSASWLYQMMPAMWDDPNRGKIPLGWAFDPSIEQRFPVGLAYARSTATTNDTFIAGDSGYGYLNPGYLVPPRKWSGLPAGLQAWQELCTRGYRRWDLRITGFVINGFSPPMNAVGRSAYATFSPDGVISQGVLRLSFTDNVPFLLMSGDIDKPAEGANQISGFYPPSPTRAHFGVFRTVLWTPSKHVRMFDLLAHERPDIQMVSPQMLMELAKRSKGNGE